MFIANNALYAIGSDGTTLMRYQGASVWLTVGQGWSQFASFHVTLFAISTDGSTVGEFNGTPGVWTPFAGSASAIAADTRSVYISNSDGVYEYAIVKNEDGDSYAETLAGSMQTTPPGSAYLVWGFKTSNSYFSGYDGEVEMTLFSNGFQETQTLPRKHFERGKTYFMQLDFDIHVFPLRGISLMGEENFLDDQWNVDYVTAYHHPSSTLCKFDVHQRVPNGQSIFVPLSSEQSVHTPPGGYVTVFVWKYLGTARAWGHASLELSDGTYISWWPQGFSLAKMLLLPSVYTVAATPNQTYADDVDLENNAAPDYRVLVGGLNESAIAKWWGQFQGTHQWSLSSQNCSTTVAGALWAGGASRILTSVENDNFHSVAIWTPNDALAFAGAIRDHHT